MMKKSMILSFVLFAASCLSGNPFELHPREKETEKPFPGLGMIAGEELQSSRIEQQPKPSAVKPGRMMTIKLPEKPAAVPAAKVVPKVAAKEVPVPEKPAAVPAAKVVPEVAAKEVPVPEKPAAVPAAKVVPEVAAKVAPSPQAPAARRQAKITAAKTFYDRNAGMAYFEGSVCVDDEEYKMHADKVYVFLDGTNDLRRIVAVGNVAMTNAMRRAYADKASYYKRNGMVVLNSGSGITAEVRDESKGSQSVRGSKIKFWLSSEQVEVVDADISTPVGGVKVGLGEIKEALGK